MQALVSLANPLVPARTAFDKADEQYLRDFNRTIRKQVSAVMPCVCSIATLRLSMLLAN